MLTLGPPCHSRKAAALFPGSFVTLISQDPHLLRLIALQLFIKFFIAVVKYLTKAT